ncbi:amidohydrolase family protein [Massilia endophytica]|uniref:amidohydrolase family protein n=1 Tax=Massilia endophytica TaxID=2899220 RepID=UPI001E55A575|nr:amidohydrolase family protein [Massilia endophytica]UGQ47426.1 amidohydrolase family protein [Massilia endophytica]
MIRHLATFAAATLMAAAAFAQPVPFADVHQHLFSPSIESLLASPAVKALDAADVVALLDRAGIQKGLILSTAYMFGKPGLTIESEYAKVRAENDWTSAQVARFPDRLRAFCGVNPLRDYALAELARCAKDPQLKRGVKLHFGNSDVQLENPEHIARLREFFRAANEHGMALAIHMRASISKKRPYGATQARAFIEQLLPMAPNVDVQIAHLAGTGPGYEDPPADEVMGVLAEAVAKGDPRTKRLYFDVASIADQNIAPADAQRLANRLRQVGMARVLYGTDAAAGDNLRPRESWAAFRRIPLSDAEFAQIAANVPAYLR